ncbi:hypothetical protein [Glutamicibacter arilaitensis]|uniref:hypothetical protein n=1 Tax=Glutamicibacter arilaitensis TaxID=256701 RepID=UPI003FD0D6A8
MPDVTGSLKSIVGDTMASRNGELIFYLNEPAVHASVITGEVNPTARQRVVPDSSGSFSVPLRSTETMLSDNFYRLRIEWLEDGMPPMDFPNWQIRVPNGAGTFNLVDLITTGPAGGGGGANAMLWWVSMDPPPNRNHIWLYLDPDDPDRATGPNPNLTLGDIVTRWW